MCVFFLSNLYSLMLTFVVDIIKFALFCVLININRIVYRQQDCFLTLNSHNHFLFFWVLRNFSEKKVVETCHHTFQEFFCTIWQPTKVELKKSITRLRLFFIVYLFRLINWRFRCLLFDSIETSLCGLYFPYMHKHLTQIFIMIDSSFH